MVLRRYTTRQGELAHVQRDGAAEAGAVDEQDAAEPAGAVPRGDPAAPERGRRAAVPPPRGAGGAVQRLRAGGRGAARLPADPRVARLLPHAALVAGLVPRGAAPPRHLRAALQLIAAALAARPASNIRSDSIYCDVYGAAAPGAGPYRRPLLSKINDNQILNELFDLMRMI